MFEYMTVQEAAKKWNLSERRVQKIVCRKSDCWCSPSQSYMAYSPKCT